MVISPWTNHLPIALSSCFSPGWLSRLSLCIFFLSHPIYCSIPLFLLF
jgi:hypothetical protein